MPQPELAALTKYVGLACTKNSIKEECIVHAHPIPAMRDLPLLLHAIHIPYLLGNVTLYCMRHVCQHRWGAVLKEGHNGQDIVVDILQVDMS